MLSLFVGRLIVDDSLPPSFLTAILPSLEDNSLGVSIVRAAGLCDSALYSISLSPYVETTIQRVILSIYPSNHTTAFMLTQ
jgi:hypothetical protein